MKILSGQVVDGQIVVEEGHLEEGALVAVLVPDSEQTFEASEEQEALLLQSIEECERGEAVTADELFARLRRPT